MADFCKACAGMLNETESCPSDFVGATSEESFAQGMAAVVLCEGCGSIQVNPAGECISKDCLCAGEPGHGVPAPSMEQ